MSTVLETALAEVAKLPPEEQDALAAWLLDEIRSEQRWSKTLAGSQAALEALASEALAEHRAGKTKPLDESPRRGKSRVSAAAWDSAHPRALQRVGSPFAIGQRRDVRDEVVVGEHLVRMKTPVGPAHFPRPGRRSFDRIAATFQACAQRLRIVLLAGRLRLCSLLILRARLLPVRTALG